MAFTLCVSSSHLCIDIRVQIGDAKLVLWSLDVVIVMLVVESRRRLDVLQRRRGVLSWNDDFLAFHKRLFTRSKSDRGFYRVMK